MGAFMYSTTQYGLNEDKTFKELNIEEVMVREVEVTDEMVKEQLKGNNLQDIMKYEQLLFPEKGGATYTKKFSHYSGFSSKFVSDKEIVARKKGVRTLPRFVVVSGQSTDRYGRIYDRERSYDTLTEAKRAAKTASLENGTDIKIKQARSGGEPSFKLGTMVLETDGKQHKTKRTSKTKVYLPMYEFTFFVCSRI